MNKELELEAMDILKSRWNYLYIFGYPKKPYPKNYENDLNNVMIGLTSKYVEKEKLEFAIEQLKEIRSKMTFFEISNMDNTLDNIHSKIEELEQKLKEYETN